VRAKISGRGLKALARKKRAKKSLLPSSNLSVEQFEPRTLMSGMGMPTGDMDAALSLVSYAAVTNTAVQNGSWSTPSTWQGGKVPGANANVLIPTGLAVTVDRALTPSLHTIRVDGTLQFATNKTTSLSVDTLVVTATGTFDMGTAAAPVAAGVTATLTFTDQAAINTVWDPHLISRGLISMGTVNMYGQAVTSFESLAHGANKGDTYLDLSQVPTNWKVGDQLILPGTDPSANQDESLTISAISGTRVTVSPLAYNHNVPETGLTVYVANVTRNVILQSANSSDIPGRGHVMFMTATVNIDYVAFDHLGRTNKLIPINDPQLDANGMLIAGTGTNPRGRYAVHFHHTGADATMPPASVIGSAVVDSPGWGYVNHDSYVNFQNDVSYDVAGAGFVTESGSEIGSFIGNMAIRDTGIGGNPDQRANNQDFGNDGDGFWFQGAGITVQNNIAVGETGFGFGYYTKGLVDLATGAVTQFAAANLPDPSVAGGLQFVAVNDVPIFSFTGNVTYGSIQGLGVWYHSSRLEPTTGGTFNNFTAWNIQTFGATFLYDDHATLQNSWLLGNLTHPGISVYGVRTGIEAMNDINFTNDRIEGWAVGIRLATVGTQHITGGFFNNIHDIDVRLSDYLQGTSITIDGNITFGTLTTAQIGTQPRYNIFMDGDPTLILQPDRFPYFFAPQTTLLNAVQYGGKQLYFNEQAPGYVPFPAGTAPSWVPVQLIGLTNQQLWQHYGLAFAGAVAPADAKASPLLNGLLGSPTTYPPTFEMVSPATTSNLLGYQLIYLDASGNRVVDPTPVNLTLGWNLITRVINGVKTTFFVYGT
jgi:hypothetical protein